jgi:hypothetical protein
MILKRTNKRKEFWYSLVIDDENEHKITAEAFITLTVHLHRENMSILFSKKMNSNVNAFDEEINDDKVRIYLFLFF